MIVGKRFLRSFVSVVLTTLSLSAFGDVIVATPQQVEELVALNALSQKYTSRIEIPYEELRKRFQELAESGNNFAEVRLGDSPHEDRLVIRRSGNTLQLYAIVDNIGTRINIKHNISNFLERDGGSKDIIIDRSFNYLAVYIIAGNVGTVINIDIQTQNRALSGISTKPSPTPKVTHTAGTPEVEVIPAMAVSKKVYRVEPGSKIRFPKGYQWWNLDSKTWEKMTSLTVDVEFKQSGFAYAN